MDRVKPTKLTYYCPVLKKEVRIKYEDFYFYTDSVSCECCGTEATVKYDVDCECGQRHVIVF